MGGYDYQIWRSIEAWLTLEDDEVIFLEGAEDIDRVNFTATTTIQVKRTQEAVSLNTQRARDAIRNFWATSERSPERYIRYVYLTTSGISLERDARFGGLSGIQVWASAAFDTELADAVREQLLASIESDQPVREFLGTATVKDLQERLLQRFTWLMEQSNVDVVEQSVLDRISDELAKLGQPRSAAHAVKSALFEYCWKQVLKERPEERQLDVVALRRQIEVATTITLELPLHTATGFVMATAQLSSLQAATAQLVLLQDHPPPPPKALLRRPSLVESVSRLVVQRRAVLLAGSVFMGKTTIAQVVARDLGFTVSWTELSQRDPAAIAQIFKLLALTLDRPDGPSLLIFDDLDTSPRARRTYEMSLRQLVHRAEVAGKSLLFTAQGHTEALGREVANSWGLEVVQVPQLSQEEIVIQCADFGCVPATRADTWSRIITAQTGGHPALVNVRLLELRADGWPAVNLETFTTPSLATLTARQLARDLLASSVSAAEAEFVLEAGEFILPPTRVMLLNLAGLPPPLVGASAVLANLTGRWIEELGADKFRVTQVLRGEVGVTWTSDQRRAIHAKLHDAILASEPLTPADASSLLFHALIAADAGRFKYSVGVVLTAKSEVQRQILKRCNWILPIEMEPGSGLASLSSTLPSLRHLQFLVAEIEDPSRLEDVAKAWRRAIGPRQADTSWMADRMLYDLTMLSKRVTISMEVVLDAISSAIEVEDPFKTILIGGLANVKASMVGESFALPESATLFQTLFSLRAGDVRTREDLCQIIEWLGRPESQELALEFDQMLDWPSVIELGGFIHSAWVAEANQDSPEWGSWLEHFDRALEACSSASLRRYGAQIARAKSIVLSEYLGDMRGGHAVLDEAVSVFGPSAVIEEQRVNLLGQSEDHVEALSVWDRMMERFGPHAVSDPFAYRRVAISAGRLKQFNRASQLFKAGAELLKEGMYKTRVGLLVDASYCSLLAGNRRRCSTLLAHAVLLLPSQASAEGSKSWEAIIQVANAVGRLSSNPGILRPDGAPVEIAIGRASEPGISTDTATEGQALRVGMLQAQAAYLEAAWPDASLAVLEKAQALSGSDSPMLRLNAYQSLIMRDATQGALPAYLGSVMGLAQAMIEMVGHRHNQDRDAPVMPEKAEEMVSGLLTLGILLARNDPLELLESWMGQADDVSGIPLSSVLDRLQRGMLMAPNEAVYEAAELRSGDIVISWGAALRICHTDNVGAKELVLAALRITSALKSGLALFFGANLNPAVARMFAERMGGQLLRPDQFSIPSLAIPAVMQTIRQVLAGEAGIRELLGVGCLVTSTNAGDALRQF